MTTAGTLFIISAPSGAGKTSLVRALLASDTNISLSVSYTTRAPRPGESDGREYHFVSRERFEEMLERGDFFESAEVYGNLYGTSQHWINEQMATGRDILLEIDCQGAQQVRKVFRQAAAIFILPPSLAVLESRLHGREQDSAEEIARRMAAAREEISHVSEFNYVIINEQMEVALADLTAIVHAERLKATKQLLRHYELIANLE